MEREQLIAELHRGGWSCVVSSAEGVVRSFTNRGVADLYGLYRAEPTFACGGMLADKVIGRGAAALAVALGVVWVYADVVSRPALELLRNNGVEVLYGELADNIINRRGDDICPVERLTMGEERIDLLIERIGQFLDQQQR